MSAYHNLDFASIQVRDLEKSTAFYTNIIGFQPVEIERPNAIVFKNDTGAIFAIRTPLRPLPEDGTLGTGASFWFDVADTEVIYQQVLENGGHVIAPPQPGPFGKQLTITDPDGYLLVFHENSNNDS